MRSRLRKVLGAALLVSVAALAAVGQAQTSDLQTPLTFRQVPPPAANIKWAKPHARAYFNSNVGSFKLMANDEFATEGTLDMTFRGTLLVSNLEPGSTIVVSGNIRKEIDDPKLKRQVYFGDGRVTIVGKFRSVQFFGRGLRAAFDGFGFVRLYGEFDRNLDTGYYWYEGAAEKIPWSTGGSPLVIPPPDAAKPRVKPKGSGG
jgi:hypothetical protein